MSPLSVYSPIPMAPPSAYRRTCGSFRQRGGSSCPRCGRSSPASPALPSGRRRAGHGRGDPVDREPTQLTKKFLVVHASQRRVVDHALRSRAGRAEVAGSSSSPSPLRPPASAPSSTSRIIRPWRSGSGLRARTNLVPYAAWPSPSKCRAASGSCRRGQDLAGLAVDSRLVRLGSVERGDHLAVGVDHPPKVRLGPRPAAAGVHQPDHPALLSCDASDAPSRSWSRTSGSARYRVRP